MRAHLGLIAALTALCITFAVPANAAKPGNARAKKLVKAAMEKDYLDLEFRAAEAKMKMALTICRERGCSTGLHARIYRYLAVVYALGLKDQDAAAFAFIDMLKLSPKLRPDKNFASEEIDRAFKEAMRAYEKEAAEEAAAAERQRQKDEEEQRRIEEEEERMRAAEDAAAQEQARAEEEARRRREEKKRLEQERREEEERKKREPPPVAQLDDEPWVEQALEIPIPVYVELEEIPEGQKVKKVVVEWISPDGERGKTTLNEHETGWGGYIPCSATKKEGELSYWVTVIQQYDHPLAIAGEEDDPRIVFIKPAVDFKQPHLPGDLPPEGCFGDEGAALSCDTDEDCPGATRCTAGQCLQLGKAKTAPPSRVQNRFALLVSPDFSLISSSEACSVASREDGRFSCFLPGGVEYSDAPISNTNAAGSFSTLAPGTLRISLAYDRVMGRNVTLGGRIGATLLGHPSRGDGKSVSPIHVEGRGGYYLGKDLFAAANARPFAHALLGYANAAGKITGIQVRPGGEDGLDVWQKGGPLVVGIGAGIEIPIGETGGIVADLSVRQHFPLALTTFAPTFGYIHGL